MKTTDNNQKKQLTELSDEDLKQVSGGTSRKKALTGSVASVSAKNLLISGDITPKQASDCLIPAVTTVSDFKDKLISNNPTKQTIIENTYAKY